MRRVLIALSCLLAFGLGYLAALFLPSIFSPHVDSRWRPLPDLEAKNGISYSTDALFKSDIPLPDMKSTGSAAKFIEDGSVRPSSIRFGYKIAVNVAPLDLSKVPAAYKKEKPIDLGGGRTITELPIEQVTYEVRFDFTLKDKDGFTLANLKSEPQNVESGKVNSFQGFSTEAIPFVMASKTETILFELYVVKCVSCEKP